MERAQLHELHFITHKANVPSILRHGILSHRNAEPFHPVSLANPDVQGRRAGIVVPGGRPLHEYANLYFNARNAMMYTILMNNAPQDVAVVTVDLDPARQAGDDLLDLHDVVITDRNAAALPRWMTSPEGLAVLDRARIYALNWNHPDPWEKERHRQEMQAEVLVPDLVEITYLKCVYVSCDETLAELTTATVPARRHHELFFGYVRR